MMPQRITPDEVLHFWFRELEPKDHFRVDEKLDTTIRDRFSNILEMAARCELANWRKNAQGRLAEIIVLDQFSRNIFRGTSRSFAQDPTALVLAQEMVQLELDRKIEVEWRSFVYMPYMHSESIKIHEEAVILFSQPGLELMLKYEHMHKKIIDRYGRFPHRNKILDRVSSPEEIEFLKSEGSSF
jgi:uncharacterized protein (DUF924 family)